jgi:hypothetical protein
VNGDDVRIVHRGGRTGLAEEQPPAAAVQFNPAGGVILAARDRYR